ncbi:MAG: glutamate formimidoyltransferase [Dysgonamonadaceae bacterium]|jgi:glutamate formiminotransferase|nr:glutamate formimidoyltransferase [Dysgonamonadaceae bacterium]
MMEENNKTSVKNAGDPNKITGQSQPEVLIECIPNFSEGRNTKIVEKIVDAFRGKDGLKLLDYSADADHNRMVVTIIGRPNVIYNAMIEAVGIAVKKIDLRTHKGQHPRIGAVDVIPFVPLREIDLKPALELAEKIAENIAYLYNLPVFLYESSASAPHRISLSEIRKGNFELLADKMKDPAWEPDFGPGHPHKSAGAVAVGVRKPLIAFNINLKSNDLKAANDIARAIRSANGGLPAVKALGIRLTSKNCVQVSMNITDYKQISMHRVLETVRDLASHQGIELANSELIGLLPLQSLIDTAAESLNIDNLTSERIIETFY